MINLNDMTVGQLKEINALLGNAGSMPFQPFEIGKPYQIRTVTFILTGRVVDVGPSEIVLEDAAWIADTGRFMTATEKAEYSEVEPFPSGRRVIVGRAALIDAVQIPQTPRMQK